jgi:hypothetical protein
VVGSSDDGEVRFPIGGTEGPYWLWVVFVWETALRDALVPKRCQVKSLFAYNYRGFHLPLIQPHFVPFGLFLVVSPPHLETEYGVYGDSIPSPHHDVLAR